MYIIYTTFKPQVDLRIHSATVANTIQNHSNVHCLYRRLVQDPRSNGPKHPWPPCFKLKVCSRYEACSNLETLLTSPATDGSAYLNRVWGCLAGEAIATSVPHTRKPPTKCRGVGLLVLESPTRAETVTHMLLKCLPSLLTCKSCMLHVDTLVHFSKPKIWQRAIPMGDVYATSQKVLLSVTQIPLALDLSSTSRMLQL